MNDNLLSLLGICRKSGRLKLGSDPALDSLSSGRAKLILAAEDTGHSGRSIQNAAATAGVGFLTVRRTKQQLSLALGKMCAVLAVEDKGFADKLTEIITAEADKGGNNI